MEGVDLLSKMSVTFSGTSFISYICHSNRHGKGSRIIFCRYSCLHNSKIVPIG